MIDNELLKNQKPNTPDGFRYYVTRSTTINLLPVLYYRTNPNTIGFGWLGRSWEWEW